MIEATIILLNMRGGCATIGDQVHALFRVNNRRSLLKRADGLNEPDGSATRHPDCLFEPQRAPPK